MTEGGKRRRERERGGGELIDEITNQSHKSMRHEKRVIDHGCCMICEVNNANRYACEYERIISVVSIRRRIDHHRLCVCVSARVLAGVIMSVRCCCLSSDPVRELEECGGGSFPLVRALVTRAHHSYTVCVSWCAVCPCCLLQTDSE